MAGRWRLCLFWLLVARLPISETRPITRNFDSAPVGPGICFHLKCLTTTCFSVYLSMFLSFFVSLHLCVMLVESEQAEPIVDLPLVLSNQAPSLSKTMPTEAACRVNSVPAVAGWSCFGWRESNKAAGCGKLTRSRRTGTWHQKSHAQASHLG